MKPIIEVSNLSKKYKIKDHQSYYSLRDSLSTIMKNPLSLLSKNQDKKDFWALKNVSFTLNPGEVVGVIGKNGAGKSTLLKILSRIIPPTHGEIVLRGRVASLLEIGTGFHPELTGEENIFLNGTLLGMTRKEIQSKFQEIINFSEIEKFIDTPVKFYSSGMYMRLAFAVAAHLEPEILIVDEVLSVGDIAFQKKCLGKMEEVGVSGRTVLFVSHNLSAVQKLCKTTIFLEQGEISFYGPTDQAIAKYLEHSDRITPKIKTHQTNININKNVKVDSFRTIDEKRAQKQTFDSSEKIGVEINYSIQKEIGINCVIQLFNSNNILLFSSLENITYAWTKKLKNKGKHKAICWIPNNLLSEGLYTLRITLNTYLNEQNIELDYPNALHFSITNEIASINSENVITNFPGVIKPKIIWGK